METKNNSCQAVLQKGLLVNTPPAVCEISSLQMCKTSGPHVCISFHSDSVRTTPPAPSVCPVCSHLSNVTFADPSAWASPDSNGHTTPSSGACSDTSHWNCLFHSTGVQDNLLFLTLPALPLPYLSP